MNPNNNETVSTQPADNDVNQPHPVNQITPVSKYLAMVLFVLLPFVGGYVGWNMVDGDVATDTPADIYDEWNLQRVSSSTDIANPALVEKTDQVIDLRHPPYTPSETCSMPDLSLMRPGISAPPVGTISGEFEYASTSYPNSCPALDGAQIATHHFIGASTLRGKIIISKEQFDDSGFPYVRFEVNESDIYKLPYFVESGANKLIGIDGLIFHPFVTNQLKGCDEYNIDSCKQVLASSTLTSPEIEISVRDFDIVLTNFTGEFVNNYGSTMTTIRYVDKNTDYSPLPDEITEIEKVRFLDKESLVLARLPYVRIVSEFSNFLILTLPCFAAKECGDTGLYRYNKNENTVVEMKTSSFYDKAWSSALPSPDGTKILTTNDCGSQLILIDLVNDISNVIKSYPEYSKIGFSDYAMGCAMDRDAKWIGNTNIEVMLYDLSNLDNPSTSSLKLSI